MVFVTFNPAGVHTNQAHPEPKAVLPDKTVSNREDCKFYDTAYMIMIFI